MTFSIRNLAFFVAWLALVVTLVAQIRIEAMRPQWTSQVPTGVIMLVNIAFALYATLTAIAVSPRNRMFWIGCSIVAVSLTVCQICGVKPTGIAGNSALLVEPIVLPGEETGASRLYRTGHLMQLESVLIYSLIPLIAIVGGWYTQWVSLQRESAS